jgi:scyllo-inositol 2-dehydrogenase (NADP+)
VIRAAVVGLGKMGISHLAIISAHPDVELVAVCDTTAYVLDVLNKYTGVRCYTDYVALLDEEKPHAVVIATPTRFHGEMVKAALDRNMHVFCEKPFGLDPAEGRTLAGIAEQRHLVTQVGYHYRFVASFQEMRRLLAAGVLGQIHHIRSEVYGSVVLRPQGATWRTRKEEGGGCLYDYASHAVDLVNYLVGAPDAVGGTVLNKLFSRDVEDEVYTTFYYGNGMTAQVAANWSDDSYRKITAKATAWGTKGRMTGDRQELQIYLRDAGNPIYELNQGWNIRYSTELTKNVWFYLRGEEYSAQIDHFLQCIKQGREETISPFASAVRTDEILAMILRDSRATRVRADAPETVRPASRGTQGLLRRIFSRR